MTKPLGHLHAFGATFANLTPEELASSRIPDNSLDHAYIDFNNEAGNHYRLIYAPASGCIQLIEYGRDGEDFRKVMEFVAGDLNGKPEGIPSEREFTGGIRGIGDIIKFWKGLRLKQKGIAQIAERYEKCFENVRISEAHYSGISAKNYENQGLPLEKLIAGGP